MPENFLQLRNGRLISLREPSFLPSDFPALFRSLSIQPRFPSMTLDARWSVGHHTILVVCLCPREAKPLALLHDLHEALLGDIPTPLKRELIDGVGRVESSEGQLDMIEARIDKAFRKTLGLEGWPLEIANTVHEADLLALAAEAETFTTKPERPWPNGKLPEPTPEARRLLGTIRLLSSQACYNELMKTFASLFSLEGTPPNAQA